MKTDLERLRIAKAAADERGEWLRIKLAETLRQRHGLFLSASGQRLTGPSLSDGYKLQDRVASLASEIAFSDEKRQRLARAVDLAEEAERPRREKAEKQAARARKRALRYEQEQREARARIFKGRAPRVRLYLPDPEGVIPVVSVERIPSVGDHIIASTVDRRGDALVTWNYHVLGYRRRQAASRRYENYPSRF